MLLAQTNKQTSLTPLNSKVADSIISKEASIGFASRKTEIKTSKELSSSSIDTEKAILLTQPQVMKSICNKALEGLNKELKAETDAKKIEELKEMKLLLEAGKVGAEAAEENQQKARNISFNGKDQVIAGLAVIVASAGGAAATAAALAQAPGADEAALTGITALMAIGIGELYGVKWDKQAAMSFTRIALGQALGAKLATKLISWIPGVGNAANAISTTVLHTSTGMALLGFCELADQKGKKPNIKEFNPEKWGEYINHAKDLKQRYK